MARPPQVTVEDIENADVPEPSNSGAVARSEEAMFAHEQTMQKSKLGIVGAVWGSKAEKPGNIAAIVLLILLAFVGGVLFNYHRWGEAFSDILALSLIHI